MPTSSRFLGLAAVLSLLPLMSLPPAGAQSTALDVTSDTTEYCERLAAQVTNLVHVSHRPAPAEVADLSAEGSRMCDLGQTRAGIMRLRRAWMLMKQPDGQVPP
jgi:phosphohistidine phosphatase SixA